MNYELQEPKNKRMWSKNELMKSAHCSDSVHGLMFCAATLNNSLELEILDLEETFKTRASHMWSGFA